MRAYKITDIETGPGSVITTTISFTGNRQRRWDTRDKLILICESSGYKFLSYTDIDTGPSKQTGILRLWKERV